MNEEKNSKEENGRKEKEVKVSKIYKEPNTDNTSMLPGDLKRSPDESFSNKKFNLRYKGETLVFIDEAFLSKF